jgi:hypothetical protein
MHAEIFGFNGRKQGKWRITLSAGAEETNAVAEALATVAAMAVSTRREDTLDIKLGALRADLAGNLPIIIMKANHFGDFCFENNRAIHGLQFETLVDQGKPPPLVTNISWYKFKIPFPKWLVANHFGWQFWF